jgi:hypothetical protein
MKITARIQYRNSIPHDIDMSNFNNIADAHQYLDEDEDYYVYDIWEDEE